MGGIMLNIQLHTKLSFFAHTVNIMLHVAILKYPIQKVAMLTLLG